MRVALFSHLVLGQAAKFFMDQRQKWVGGGGIAGLFAFEDAGDIAQAFPSRGKIAGDNLKCVKQVKVKPPYDKSVLPNGSPKIGKLFPKPEPFRSRVLFFGGGSGFG
jgi:hypothetical protein